MTTLTPFGNSETDKILWWNLTKLKKCHVEYVLSEFNEYCLTVKQLYAAKIHQREQITHMLLNHTLGKVSKYLSGDAYTYYCNVLVRNTRRLKGDDK